MNTDLLFKGQPPQKGAFQLLGASPLGNPGDWIDISSGAIINLSTGGRLPMNAPRHGYGFAGSSVQVPDVHYPVPLASYLSGLQNGRFLHDALIQQHPVDFEQFKYRKLSVANTFLLEDPSASRDSAPKEGTISSSLESAQTEDFRFAIFVSHRPEQQGDFNVMQTSLKRVWTVMALWREYKAFGPSGQFMTSGNWDSSIRQALGATENWGPTPGDDSNPIAVLRAANDASLSPIKYFAMNQVQFGWFLSHPETIAYFTAFNAAGVTAGLLTQAKANAGDPNLVRPYEFVVPGIGVILVHNGRATTDATVAPTRFWSNDIVLGFAHSASMPPNDDAATAIEFVLKNPTSAGSGGMAIAGLPEGVLTNTGWSVRMVDVPIRGAGGTLAIVDTARRTIMTDNNIGAFISGVS